MRHSEERGINWMITRRAMMASKNQPLHNTIAELWRSVRIDNIKVESVGGQDSP